MISIEGLNGVIDVAGNGIQIQTSQSPTRLELLNDEVINVQAWQRAKLKYFENEFFIFDYDDIQGFWFITLKPLPEHLVGWEFIASATVDTTANFPAFFDFMNAVGVAYKIFPTTVAKNDRIRFNVSIRPIINFDGPQPKAQTPHFQQECWRTIVNEEQNFQVSSVLRRIDFTIKQFDNI